MADPAEHHIPIYDHLSDEIDLSKPWGLAGPPPSDEPVADQDWTGWQEIGATENGANLRTLFGGTR